VTICDIMRHYVTLCDIMRHYATLCDIMQHYVTLCSIMWHYAALCDIMRRYVTLCGIMWHYAAKVTFYDKLLHFTTYCDILCIIVSWGTQASDRLGLVVSRKPIDSYNYCKKYFPGSMWRTRRSRKQLRQTSKTSSNKEERHWKRRRFQSERNVQSFWESRRN